MQNEGKIPEHLVSKEDAEAHIARLKTDLEVAKTKENNVAKLSQYNDPTAHFRMIREEVSQAVKDGVKTMQFPT